MGIVSRFLQRSSNKRQSRVYVDYVSSDEELPTSPTTTSRVSDLVCSQVSIKSTIQDLLSGVNQDLDSKQVKQYLDDMVKLMDSCNALNEILVDLQLYAKSAQRALNISSKTGKWNRATMLRLKNALDRMPSPTIIMQQSTKKSRSTLSLIRTASLDTKLKQLIQQQLPIDIESFDLSIKKISSSVQAALVSSAGPREMDIIADVSMDAAAATAQLLEASTQKLHFHVDALFRSLRDARVALSS